MTACQQCRIRLLGGVINVDADRQQIKFADHKGILDIDHLIRYPLTDASNNLGTFTGSTIADNETIKGAAGS